MESTAGVGRQAAMKLGGWARLLGRSGLSTDLKEQRAHTLTFHGNSVLGTGISYSQCSEENTIAAVTL